MIQPLPVIQHLPSELEEGLGLAFARPGSNSDRTKSTIAKGIRTLKSFSSCFAHMQRCRRFNLVLFTSDRWNTVSYGVIAGEASELYIGLPL